jgi:hypothetical protein
MIKLLLHKYIIDVCIGIFFNRFTKQFPHLTFNALSDKQIGDVCQVKMTVKDAVYDLPNCYVESRSINEVTIKCAIDPDDPLYFVILTDSGALIDIIGNTTPIQQYFE